MVLLRKRMLSILPALAMVAGAGALYLANIGLQRVLDAESYGIYGMYITAIAVVFSFGLLGGEQVFVRLCRINDDTVLIGYELAKSIIFAFAVSVLMIILVSIWQFGANGLLVSMTLIGQVLLLFLYNLFRVKKCFFQAQVYASLWKVLLLVCLVIYWLIDESLSINSLFQVVCAGTWIAVVLMILSRAGYKSIVLVRGEGIEVFQYFLPYFVSLGTLTVLGNIDRIMIGRHFGMREFGEFFYLINIYVSPLLIIAGYIGFSQVVQYKQKLSLAILHSHLFKYAFFIQSGLLIYWFGLHVLEANLEGAGQGLGIKMASNDKVILVMFFLLVLVRVLYSVLSSAMGARGTPPVINVVNAFSLLLMIILVVVIESLNGGSIQLIIACTLLMWIGRCIAFYWGVRRSI